MTNNQTILLLISAQIKTKVSSRAFTSISEGLLERLNGRIFNSHYPDATLDRSELHFNSTHTSG